jgi:hypothetical protein
MFNPLIDNINDLNDMQVEEKVAELSKKYWQTRNPEVQMQIGTALNQFKEELYIRKQKEMNKPVDDGDNSLDKLIKVS